MSGVPYRLLRHQLPMLLTGARVIGHTLLNALRLASRQPAADSAVPLPEGERDGSGAASPIAPVTHVIAPVTHVITPVARVIAAPPADLVEAYAMWAGVAQPDGGNGDTHALPPHMVSQWSLPLVGELLLRMPYKLTSVINQGVGLRVHGPLPRGVPLHVRAAVEQIEETPGRIKVVVAVSTGTAEQASLVEARLHMSFLLPGPRPPRSARQDTDEPPWQAVGQWHADADDGLRFALLTGDFNPIHWCGPLARRSVFRGLVLHGFGSFVRSYELLKQQGIEFNEIDVRFVKPVPLPCSALAVQIAPAEASGQRAIRLTGTGDTLHLAGNLR